jgi:integrase
MLRRSELINLTWEDVDSAGQVIHVRNKADFTVKGMKTRVVPLSIWPQGHSLPDHDHCRDRGDVVFVAFFREEERTMSYIVWVMIMLFSLMTVPTIMRDRGT